MHFESSRVDPSRNILTVHNSVLNKQSLMGRAVTLLKLGGEQYYHEHLHPLYASSKVPKCWDSAVAATLFVYDVVVGTER